MKYTDIIFEKASARLKNIGGKILCGFSGGADSTVLLTVLIKIFGAENITAVHVNHMLRGADADADEEFCREFAEKHGVAFICRRVDIRALCGNTSVEETARNARYEIFAEAANTLGADFIALAHNASDNLETVLFNMCRGSGLSGMRGIPFSRPCGKSMIIRPLLDCTKSEILGFADENGLSFVTDKTNSDTHYTRNFIRANIVPSIKTLFPQAEKSVGFMCDSLSLDYDFLQRQAADFINANISDGKIPQSALILLHSAVLRRVLSELCPVLLDFRHTEAAEELIRSGTDGKLSVSDGIFAICSNGVFFFGRSGEKPKRCEFSFPLSEGANASPLGFCVIVGESGDVPSGYALIGTAEIDSSALSGLTARSRRAGDRYHFWKMTRTIKKMVGSLTENAKKIRPVICDGERILWYPGFPAAECTGDEKTKLRYYESQDTTGYDE